MYDNIHSYAVTFCLETYVYPGVHRSICLGSWRWYARTACSWKVISRGDAVSGHNTTLRTGDALILQHDANMQSCADLIGHVTAHIWIQVIKKDAVHCAELFDDSFMTICIGSVMPYCWSSLSYCFVWASWNSITVCCLCLAQVLLAPCDLRLEQSMHVHNNYFMFYAVSRKCRTLIIISINMCHKNIGIYRRTFINHTVEFSLIMEYRKIQQIIILFPTVYFSPRLWH